MIHIYYCNSYHSLTDEREREEGTSESLVHSWMSHFCNKPFMLSEERISYHLSE